MRMTRMGEEDEVRAFAERAASNFANHERHSSYTDADIEAGCLFALRFGLGEDCVIVFRLDENFEPINYQQLIKNIAVNMEHQKG